MLLTVTSLRTTLTITKGQQGGRCLMKDDFRTPTGISPGSNVFLQLLIRAEKTLIPTSVTMPIPLARFSKYEASPAKESWATATHLWFRPWIHHQYTCDLWFISCTTIWPNDWHMSLCQCVLILHNRAL